jgi:hypothetical protein
MGPNGGLMTGLLLVLLAFALGLILMLVAFRLDDHR